MGCSGASSNSSESSAPVSDNSDATEEPISVTELVEKTGVWTGAADQTNTSWTIEITLSEIEQVINYPSLLCGGYLTLIHADETTLLFRETITYGNSGCVDQGLVELIEDADNKLLYNFYYDDQVTISLGAWGEVRREL